MVGKGGRRFRVPSPSGSVTLPAEQSELDSLGVRIRLKQFTGGGIRRPVAIPGTYRGEGKSAQGVIAGGGEKALMATFVKGAENLLGVALIIGIARGVTVVLDDGQVSGTLLYYSSQVVSGMPRPVFIVALMLVFAGLTLFISSSSGMAVLTMPIMGSLAVVVGVPSEQIVNAYLYGFGLMSFLAPTGMVLPSLAMVDVPYSTFVRFVTPLLLMLGVIAAAFLVVGVLV